ncbi:MAG: glycosyltransferase family 39 protein [Terracidiphilus sp.]|nr:glycosyltransferase family 39 protein [Terracidiphilus sp.]
MQKRQKRVFLAAWLAAICVFALLHAIHLNADFPNNTPWHSDWAKYTDEGWYGNAAVRDRLFGHWYVPGDFTPAPQLPLWPALEWAVFCFAGVSLHAARALAVFFFFVNLGLSYLLLGRDGPRWRALLALTLAATSPFLYAFSRLAILEPLLTALTLTALNIAVRLPRLRRPVAAAAGIGLLFTAMMLTKTTAVFLLPALMWAVVQPLRRRWKTALACVGAAGATAAATYGSWLALISRAGYMEDYHYLIFINTYEKPQQWWWPAMSFWWSFHGGLWVDHILVPLAGAIALAALVCWPMKWSRTLRLDPVFGASILAVAGYIGFMTLQNHPQPRYFAVVAVFSFFLVALGAAALVEQAGVMRQLGWAVVVVAAGAVVANAAWTVSFAAFPEYTFVTAARNLTHYIDEHPNGKRLLVSISGDEITMETHLPSLCDDFGTTPLESKLAQYQPGWYAAWNDLDPGTLADIHTHFSLEQVATFRAFDDPERNVLVLFKLHPLPRGHIRDESDMDMEGQLPGDHFTVPIE